MQTKIAADGPYIAHMAIARGEVDAKGVNTVTLIAAGERFDMDADAADALIAVGAADEYVAPEAPPADPLV